jgi:hypothetical protein
MISFFLKELTAALTGEFMASRFFHWIGFVTVCVVFFSSAFSYEAYGRALPKMQESTNLKCSGSTANFDLYAPMEKGSFPVVITVGLGGESQITGEPVIRSSKKKAKAKSRSKPHAKPSAKKMKAKKSKKSRNVKTQTTMAKATEMFFTLQGYVVANLRPSVPLSPASLAKDIACAVAKAKEIGGIAEQVFVVSRSAKASFALSLVFESSRPQVVPGLLGIIGIEPKGKVASGKNDQENAVPVMIVAEGRHESDADGLEAVQQIKRAHVPLRLLVSPQKKRGDLSSELGMATDAVTRDVMDFIRQRLKEVLQSGSADALTSAAPVPSTGTPAAVSTPDVSDEEP